MNSELPSRDQIEERITALLLGELPPAEAELLRFAIAQDAAWQKLHDELAATIVLVNEAAKASAAGEKGEALKLTAERRQQLLAHFQTPRPQPQPLFWLKRIEVPSFVTVLALVAIMMVLAAMLLPALSKAKSKAQHVTALNAARMRELDARLAVEDQPAPADVSATLPTTVTVSPAPPLAPPPAGIVLPDVAAADTESPQDQFMGSPAAAWGGFNASKTDSPVDRPPAAAPVVPPSEYPTVQDFSQRRLAPQTRMESVEKSWVLPEGSAKASDGGMATPSGPTVTYAAGNSVIDFDNNGTINQDRSGTLDVAGRANPDLAAQSQRAGGASGGNSGGGRADDSEFRLKDAVSAERKPAAGSPGEHLAFSDARPSQNNWPASAAGGLAQNQVVGTERYYRNNALENSTDKVPVVGDVPLAGSLITSRSVTAPALVVAPPPASPASSLGLDGDFGPKSEVEQSAGSDKKMPKAGSGMPTASGSEGLAWSADTALRGFYDDNYSSGNAAIRARELPASGSGTLTMNGVQGYSGSTAVSGGMIQNNSKTDQLITGGLRNRFPGSVAGQSVLTATKGLVDTFAVNSGKFYSELTRDDVNGRHYLFTPNQVQPEISPADGLPVVAVNKPVRRQAQPTFGRDLDTTPAIIFDSSRLGRPDETPLAPAQKLNDDEKRALAMKREMQQLLLAKIKQEELDSAIPKTSMVQITDAAEPAKSQSFWQGLKGEYASSARIKVESDGLDIPGLSTPATATAGYDSYFVPTTLETIRSEAVLGKVVDSLKLDEAWAKNQGGGKLTKADAIVLLKKRLVLKPVQNTKLIEIGATSSQPDEAAKIANAVAEAYRDDRLASRQQLVQKGIETLRQQYDLEEKNLRAAQAEVDRLKPQTVSEPADKPLPKRSPNAPMPQPEFLTRENAFSTFSLNVSDVSFKLAAASLERGQLPEAASIRSEEFINAFDYRDPEAAAGQPLAFVAERARSPFAQNRDLLRFAIKTAAAGRPTGRALNLVLLLDNSGSMERADRVAIIREALRGLATQLQPQDTVSVVTFARTARLWADGVAGDQAGETLSRVGDITPDGGTNLEEALRLAYATARRHYRANGLNRVVLLTDGAANLGNVAPAALQQMVEAQRQQGLALDCFGIGFEDFNDDLLGQLASHGDGRYAFLNSAEDVAQDFAGKLAGALQVAAADVKVQVEFNPQRVVSWRQIGYAKHQLTKEQFRDNTVDAAEIAAQEAGNALYTVETRPDGVGPVATVRVRYKVPGTTEYRERSWDVDYTGSAPALAQSSAALRLAATAGAFSEWLAGSPFAQAVTLDELQKILGGVPEAFGADSRPTQLATMIREAKSLAGK